MKIAILTSRKSETDFYRLLAQSSNIPIKQLCRKVPRTMVYRYLKQLQQIQEQTGAEIFSTSAEVCPVTSLPTKVISTSCAMEVKELFSENCLVTLDTR